MAASELAVVVLWHMHQPEYTDSFTGRVAMPWVRLHALLSYYDMVRLVREVPAARVVFNLVPCLLRQLEAAAAGRGDDFLALATADPADLSAAERLLLTRRFFAFHHGRRFAELPRLGELWQKRESLGGAADERAASAFSDGELRDLQVGFHLAWSGRTLREEPFVAGLFRKGRGFSTDEKRELLALQQEFLAGVLPAYRQIAADRLAEISCTPYDHPILPLLCDLRSALESRPELKLPAVAFAYPGDARFHVQAALAETERLLGVRPAGMWPAEGSLSEEAIRIAGAAGVRWLASDEEVLAASWSGQADPEGGHFRPYRLGGGKGPALFFRDKGLSDRIGFVYSGWTPQRAAADLVGHAQQIRDALPGGRFVLPIILDGENAWEAYANNGVDFLRELYAGIATAPGCRWTTFSEYLEDGGEETALPLPRLRAGSWIRHDFTTWIGHPEKNRAWERLAETRAWLASRLAEAGALGGPKGAGASRPVALAAGGPAATGPLAEAWRALAAAEGSDWFWWYGDDHATEFAVEFDALFRTHLVNVYRHLGQEPPASLLVPVLERTAREAVRPPRAPLLVKLDGKVTSYFEWLDAGRWLAGVGQGAMQRADEPVAALWFGGDAGRLLLRIDAAAAEGAGALAGLTVGVHRSDRDGTVARSVALEIPAAAAGSVRARRRGAARSGRTGAAGVAQPIAAEGGSPELVCGRIVELAVPWPLLGVAPGEEFAFFVTLERDGQPEGRVPPAGTLPMRAPLGEDDGDWLV
jgi:alpha-amylase/alpha-mannosidase (GH57 family)